MTARTTEWAGGVGIAILARAPVAGEAKTRLIPALGKEGAAQLQRWLLRHTLATAVEAAVGPVTLWCAGDLAHPDFVACEAERGVTLRAQCAGDLGERMLAIVRHQGAAFSTLLMGTDCPALTPVMLRHAAQRLRQREAVVMPAEDGGYVLLGLRDAHADIFADIEWGTASVMADTRARLIAAGLDWDELDPSWDVDRPADLDRLFALFPAAHEFLGTGRTT